MDSENRHGSDKGNTRDEKSRYRQSSVDVRRYLERALPEPRPPLLRSHGHGVLAAQRRGLNSISRQCRFGSTCSRAHDIGGTGPQFEEERLFRIVDALDIVAMERGRTVAQVVLNWLLRRPTVSTVIVGPRFEEQLVQNIGAVR